MQQKERIEAESLESTQRSLRLLQESEDIGISTAEELQKQREQLERTDRNLDNINSTLRYTQKKIDGFKSVFSSIKNYLTKKSDSPAVAGVSKDNNVPSADRTFYGNERKDVCSPDEHPGKCLKKISLNSEDHTSDLLSVNDTIDRNLDQMCISVKNIKGLALNLGEEIESQNDLIDRIMDKSDRADITLNKQCREMNKLIKKK
ncbi:UNVERIFIED_CONTAM: hypothetical protein PYX00_008878 [Menopon gallinae]|uniref:t-SNARE coiled-coil homology domain-containing protein n=1 Tax=Menopon gallinae TaxID=328185 RepID=A0AAW2H9C2_9NEOP